jgi:RHS repeat-associated protein
MPTTTNYIWDEQNYLAESDGTNAINVVYTNEPQRYGNLISSRISGTTSYHGLDALGSTRQLTNSAGTATDTAIYDAWGNVVARTGTIGARLLWIGAEGYYYDGETALTWVRLRPYLPSNARWTSMDVLLPRALGNRFAYVENRVNYLTDPSGMQGCPTAPIITPAPSPGSGICQKEGQRDTTRGWSFTELYITEDAGSKTVPLKIIQMMNCFYTRKVDYCYKCSPACFKPAAAPPANEARRTGIRVGVIKVLVDKPPIASLSASIPTTPKWYTALVNVLNGVYGFNLPPLTIKLRTIGNPTEAAVAVGVCEDLVSGGGHDPVPPTESSVSSDGPNAFTCK